MLAMFSQLRKRESVVTQGLANARLPGDRDYAALARCPVVNFSPTINDGFTVDMV
jgi:hypothetical protein